MKVTTMRGQVLDVGQIMAQNETAVAVGNAKMNARGDIVGPGGTIVKRKEQVAQEYHQKNPNAVKRVSLKDLEPDTFMTPQDVNAAIEKLAAQPAPAAKGRKIVDTDE